MLHPCTFVTVSTCTLRSYQFTSTQGSETLSAHREGRITPGALVLCPNAALCNQVKSVADSLTNLEGTPLLDTAHVSSSSPPPFNIPDILVCTPASLISVTQASHYGPEWTKGGVLAR